MPVEIGQVIIQCDRCLDKMVHDPTPLASSGIPTWSAHDAIKFAHKSSWEVTDRETLCPSCVSEMAAVRFNRKKLGPVVATEPEHPIFHARLVEIAKNGQHKYKTNNSVSPVIFLGGIQRPQNVVVGDVGTMQFQPYRGRGGWFVFTKVDVLVCDRCGEEFSPYEFVLDDFLYCAACQDEIRYIETWER